jgi:hypothetical protein
MQFLFIWLLTQQPKGRLQSEQEWQKDANTHKVKDKAIYNIWVIVMAIKW